MRRMLLIGLLLPGSILAQEAPGKNLSIDAAASSASVLNDVATIDYVLSSAPGSTEQLFQFIVEAPAPVTRIGSPEPAIDWKVDTEFRSMSVAMWTVLGDQVGPGQSSLTLSVSAVGLPGIVDAWYRGWVPPQPLPDDIPLDYAFDPLADASVPTRVLGIEPVSEREPDPLLLRLHGLIQEACGEISWISASARCDALGDFTLAARGAVTALRFADARAHLDGVLSEIETGLQSGDLKRSAYWLIRVNTELIRDLLPNPPSADAGGPYTTIAGTPVTLDGTASTDPVGLPLTYSWDFGDGSTGTGSWVTHTYGEAGSYEATLTVGNTLGHLDVTTTSVTVTVPLPTVLAALVPVPDKSLKHNNGHFTVEYSCQGGTVTSAMLNGVPVQNGDEAQLELKSKKSEKDSKSEKSKKGKDSAKSLKLADTSFELVVVCENVSGSSTATASPVFAEKSVKSKKGG